MVDIASQMILFAHVVDHGSFSASARALGYTPSAVSKQIGHLEDRLGVRLLNRSTRKVSLTEEGKAFHQRCAAIAKDVGEAEAQCVALGQRPQGTLRVAATVAFGKAQLLPLLPAFLNMHPDLRIKLELTDQSIDLAESEFDLAIRFTEQIEHVSVVTRKLASNRRLICAAPAYLNMHGIPETLEDLKRHNCLRLSSFEPWNDWVLGSGEDRQVFHASGNFETSSADAVYHAALAGLGVARLSTYLIGPDIQAGRLVHLLPDHCDDEAEIHAVYSDRHNLSPKVRAFIDYLVGHFGPVPPWERPRKI